MARRSSRNTDVILQAMLDAPEKEASGLQICDSTRLPADTVYPILRCLEDDGLLAGRWESLDVAVSTSARPPRYLYRLTDDGTRAAMSTLRSHRRAPRRVVPGWTAPAR